MSVSTLAADGTRAAATDASAALIKRADVSGAWPYQAQAATHEYDAATHGYTKFVGTAGNEAAEGEWLLIVSKAGMGPVTQRLTLKKAEWTENKVKHEALRAAPGWASNGEKGDGARAATVEITNAGKGGKNTATPQFTEVKVVLVARTEFVGYACHNHLDGTDYAQFTRDRRDVLYLRGTDKNAATYTGAKLDMGSIATLFHADDRKKRTYLKSAAAAASSWILVYEEQKADLAADAGLLRPYDTAANEYGIMDVYSHLDGIGREHPGTCVEAGVFGHGWANGPLLWNTADAASSTTTRDPLDLDGRQKDWLQSGDVASVPDGVTLAGPTQEGLPNLPAAFVNTAAFKGRFRLWGCSHMRRAISEMTTAWARFKLLDQGTTTRSALFYVPLRDIYVDNKLGQMQGWEYASLDHLKANIFGFIGSRAFFRIEEDGDGRRSVNYIGAAAQFLRSAGALVFGSPPGMGSLYKGVQGTGRKGAITFYIRLDGGENGAANRYLAREFGAYYRQDEDGLGFLNYSRMLETPAGEIPSPGWATGRSMAFYDADQSCVVLRLPSTLEVHKAVLAGREDTPHLDAGVHPGRAFRQPVTHAPDGHLYVMPLAIPGEIQVRGHREVLILARDTGDTALHVQNSGQITMLYRAASSDPWQTYAVPVPRVTVTFIDSVTWGTPRTLASPPEALNGVLQTVAPDYYW